MAYQESILNSKFSHVKKQGEGFKKFEEITKPIPNPYQLPQNAKDLLGNYGLGKEIIFKDGKLWLKNYQHSSPIYMTAPNTFLVEGDKRHSSSTVAKPIYLFFRKGLEEESEENESEENNLNTQDSSINMFVRYGDFTSAKFTQVEKYTFDKEFIKAPKEIKEYAIKLWNKNILQKWK